jgi:hypothetical protein
MNIKLTMEQQFELAKVKAQIEYADPAQIRLLFVELYAATMLKDNINKELLANHWGIDRAER